MVICYHSLYFLKTIYLHYFETLKTTSGLYIFFIRTFFYKHKRKVICTKHKQNKYFQLWSVVIHRVVFKSRRSSKKKKVDQVISRVFEPIISTISKWLKTDTWRSDVFLFRRWSGNLEMDTWRNGCFWFYCIHKIFALKCQKLCTPLASWFNFKNTEKKVLVQYFFKCFKKIQTLQTILSGISFFLKKS